MGERLVGLSGNFAVCLVSPLPTPLPPSATLNHVLQLFRTENLVPQALSFHFGRPRGLDLGHIRSCTAPVWMGSST